MLRLFKNRRFLQLIGILVGINIIVSYTNFSIDLTGDKRYTLTQATKDIVKAEDDIVTVKTYLSGELPSGINRVKDASFELLSSFKKLNSNLIIEVEDPSEGTPEEVKARFKQLTDDGLIPTSLKVFDGKKYEQKVIFPYVVFQIGQRRSIVNLLEAQSPGQDEQEVLQQSASLLEYKFGNALQKLQLTRKKNIVFTSGHGELQLQNTVSLERQLRKWYNTGRIVLDSIVKLDSLVDLVIVADPQSSFDDQSKFKLDQYLMNGGKILWLVEKLNASLDSIAKYEFYIPSDINHGLDDILFKYGVRVMPNLIMDLESTNIPQVVGQNGDKPQTMMFRWPYHPVVASKSDHPIVKNIDRVNFYFPSQLDTVKTAGNITKTVLMSSSQYSKLQFNPMRLNFQILKQDPDPNQYKSGNIPIAVLLEGKFESAYKNKLTSDFQATLAQLNQPFVPLSKPTKQIVISDVDFAKNLINSRTQEPEEIGFNKWEVKYYKGNKDFILNSIEYLLDDGGVLTARSKELKLRPLNQVKVEEEKTFWQVLNVLAPLLILALSGMLYFLWRKKKYAI